MTDAPLPVVPLYLQGGTPVTAAGIAARLLASMSVPETVDSSPFSLLGSLVTAVSVELAQVPAALQAALADTFMTTTTDLTHAAQRGLERGLAPLPATFAQGMVTFTGTAGTVIPAFTRVAAPAVGSTPAVVFATTQQASIPIGGTTEDVSVIALVAGSGGNVAQNTVTLMVDHVNGISAVTNAYVVPATTAIQGGTDAETLAAFVARWQANVNQPLTGENLPTYQQWAEAVAGVGGALALRQWGGPGTVGLYLVDSTGAPASVAIVKAVEDAIIAPWRLIEVANLGTKGGAGVAGLTDDTQGDAHNAPCEKFAYNASGTETLTFSNIHLLLPQPGIWRVRPRMKKGGTLGTGNLLTVAVNDVTTSAVAPAAPSGGTATKTFAQTDLTTAFQGDDAGTDPYGVDLYWNGTDVLNLVVTRLTADTSTTVWLDEILFQSTMPNDTPGVVSLQSAADRVLVQPASTVAVVVSVHLVETTGSVDATVKAAVETAVQAYLSSLRFAVQNTIVWGRVAAAILNTVGVQSITPSSLLINGAQADLTIQPYQVPVLVTPVTWT